MGCGSFIMPEIISPQSGDLRKQIIAVRIGMISMCLPISRWRDTTCLSTPMCSIHGKGMTRLSRARYQSISTLWQAM